MQGSKETIVEKLRKVAEQYRVCARQHVYAKDESEIAEISEDCTFVADALSELADIKEGKDDSGKKVADLEDVLKPILAVVVSGGIKRVGNRTSIWECLDAIRKAQSLAIERGIAENHTCDNCATKDCESRGELGWCSLYTKADDDRDAGDAT